MAPLLRGILHVTIHEANNLPPNETVKSKVTGFFKKAVGKQANEDHMGVYVNVLFADMRLITTETFDHGDELNPKWNQHFRLDLALQTDHIIFELKGDRVGPDKTIARLHLNAAKLIEYPNNPECWECLSIKGKPPVNIKEPDVYELCDKNGNIIPNATIRISIKYLTAETSSESPELYDGYFPMHNKCRVTLYQDACTPKNDFHDQITMWDGSPYRPTNAFKDIYEHILNAKHFIYLTGWSVWAHVVLVRDDDTPALTLGELLKQKSQEGVKVLGMVWDEKASTGITTGLMGTHDEETNEYFKGTNVRMILVYRQKKKGLTMDQFYSTCYSHHQKCVIVDAEHPRDSNLRLPVAFIGGLDLTSGRYDTPDHELYTTLTGAHKGDFYQNCVSVSADLGPRQPWHDIHSKYEGQVVIDALQNFEERWRKQAPSYLKGELLNIRADPTFDTDCSYAMSQWEEWNCQLLRSITSESANFNTESRFRDKLTWKGKVETDDSIHRAYVHHIRRAQKFIYIENQYFLGSAYAWRCNNKPKAHHIIPFEIAKKICEKIAANEDFHVYIVVPMYPEGDPSSQAVQDILLWQCNTISMMYGLIADAIQTHQRATVPQDYLSFFCLGKRESQYPENLPPTPDPNSKEAKLRRTRRFMIYVHSKMMIIDDSYIIIGSANINQRSMGGTRDTEIAVCSYQPNFIYNPIGSYPKGNIYGFRMSLFSEHLKMVEPEFSDPGSVECVKRVQGLAQANWEAYVSDQVQDTPGFLMTYPIHIDANDGKVVPLTGCEKFPDTNANILGSKNPALPDRLTT